MLRCSIPATALVAVICLISLPATAAPADVAPLTLDDLTALLEAGIGEPVILKHLAAAGTEMEPTVQSLLALKRAGASDDFLEALLERTPSEQPLVAPAPDEPGGPFRIYYSENDSGERVLHLTNLDESGRRIGGEVEHPAPRNIVAEREPMPDIAEPPAPAPQAPPVMINILPPGDPGPYVDDDGPSREYGEPFAGAYLQGRYPGFYGFVPRHYRPRHFRGGYVVHHNPLLPSPPGSYSHFLQFHQGGHSGPGFSYTHATAAQRNKARFRRR